MCLGTIGKVLRYRVGVDQLAEGWKMINMSHSWQLVTSRATLFVAPRGTGGRRKAGNSG